MFEFMCSAANFMIFFSFMLLTPLLPSYLSDTFGADKQTIGIFIGPEGGFEEDEVAIAANAGIHPITLGKRILRTETAGLCILSVIMFELEQ